MKKIKLMHITHDLAIGGLQKVVVNLCQAANRDVFDVSVLCLRTIGEFGDEIHKLNIPVMLLPQKNSGVDYFSFLKVRKILQAMGTEVIHTHNTQPFVDGTLGSIFSSVKTIVHTDHARDFPDKRRYMFAEWLMSKLAYKIVGVSEHTTYNLHKYEKIVKAKLITIPNGVSRKRFEELIDKSVLRQELGIRPVGQIIGLGVRLSKQKGLTYLLDAMKIVIKEQPDISLIIAGDGPLRSDLEKQSESNGLSENVFFVGPRTDIPRLLKLFDVYVLPSLWEGLPMVLLETMAAGCPVVATDVGGVSTAIKHEVNGLLVPPGDVDSLGKAIVRLLGDCSLQQKFIKEGRVLFEKRFSAEKMARQYEKLYQRR